MFELRQEVPRISLATTAKKKPYCKVSRPGPSEKTNTVLSGMNNTALK